MISSKSYGKRHGKEYRFDFERLGLRDGEWDWRLIDDAYGEFQKLSKEGAISNKEFMLIQESYQSLADFMMRKLYFLSRYPILKNLFYESVVNQRTSFLQTYGQRLNEKDGLQLGYDVFTFKTKDSNVEVIVPNLYRQKLIPNRNL